MASGLAVLTAGCTSFDFTNAGEEDGCTPDYYACAKQFDPATELPPEYGSRQQTLARRVIQQGRATATYGPQPLKRDSFVVDDGAYYRVELVESRSVGSPALILTVEWKSE